MNIEFDCPKCGRHYKVSPGMAGKRGPCKQCGVPLTIPDPAAAAGLELIEDDDYGVQEDEPAAEVLAPLVRKKATASRDTQAPAKKKKKKAGGLFSFGSGAKGGGGSSAGAKAGLGGGIGTVIFLLAVGLRLAGVWGLSSRADLERITHEQISAMNGITAICREAHDGESAKAAAQKALPAFRGWSASIRKANVLKFKKTDMDSVLEQNRGPLQAAGDDLRRAMDRMKSFRGAEPAVSITLKPALDELAGLLENPGAAGGAGRN